ncbi:hypothetical protein [Pseudomonas sp. On1]|uniref:hypothetical protein n=1 Tax=Pseudomonas sp. On1 TaxID=3083258 RepID=UPI0029AB8224|nr:hypothetical protein [Pseudomonas sp. On1]MDX2309804.1 hypothetical protein [Pseudomonas sp. On1]
MFHTNQLQALFDQLEALQQFDMETQPADLKAVLVKVNEERQKLITLDQRLMIGVRDTRHSTDYYPVLVPRSRSYGDEDFKGTFDTSADTSEDYTYVVDCAGTKVEIISREGEA